MRVLNCNGKTYRVEKVNQRIKKEFEKAMLKRAKEALEQDRAYWEGEFAEQWEFEIVKNHTKEDYVKHRWQRKLQEINDDYTQNKFSLISEHGRRALSEIGGQVQLLALLLNCDELEVLDIFSEKPEEMNEFVQEIMEESFPFLRRVRKSQPPVAADATSGPAKT
jgi:hypothetical protein